jgi:drug/metabolite transporter (DMT)-like permease
MSVLKELVAEHVAETKSPLGARLLRPGGRASASPGPGRADWPIILSVGALQLTCFFAFANLGVQIVPPGRSGVLAYTIMLWMVPLSWMVGEKVGRRAFAGAALGVAGILVLVDPLRFDWSDRRVMLGHGWLLAAGFTWALAILHARRHAWRMSPLDVLPWQMGVATVLLWILAFTLEPAGHLDLQHPSLWLVPALSRRAWPAPPRPGPPSPSRAPCRRSPARSACWACRLLAIASSVVLVGEPVTWPLAIGTALVIAGIAIVDPRQEQLSPCP